MKKVALIRSMISERSLERVLVFFTAFLPSSGNFAVVKLGIERSTGRRVAIKVITFQLSC